MIIRVIAVALILLTSSGLARAKNCKELIFETEGIIGLGETATFACQYFNGGYVYSDTMNFSFPFTDTQFHTAENAPAFDVLGDCTCASTGNLNKIKFSSSSSFYCIKTFPADGRKAIVTGKATRRKLIVQWYDVLYGDTAVGVCSRP